MKCKAAAENGQAILIPLPGRRGNASRRFGPKDDGPRGDVIGVVQDPRTRKWYENVKFDPMQIIVYLDRVGAIKVSGPVEVVAPDKQVDTVAEARARAKEEKTG